MRARDDHGFICDVLEIARKFTMHISPAKVTKERCLSKLKQAKCEAKRDANTQGPRR